MHDVITGSFQDAAGFRSNYINSYISNRYNIKLSLQSGRGSIYSVYRLSNITLVLQGDGECQSFRKKILRPKNLLIQNLFLQILAEVLCLQFSHVC